jgi:predicted GNAT family N-acyltransferase
MNQPSFEREQSATHKLSVLAESAVIHFNWRNTLDTELSKQIITLMRETSATAPIIGFGAQISDAEASGYIQELKDNLQANKCLLLSIWTEHGELIGLCTLKRNQNPNNSHIADLAKGMIAERYRGGQILAAALYEIALECERRGVELVTLDVRAGSRAGQVWQHYGFEIYGTLADYARSSGTSHTGHFMKQLVADLKSRTLRNLTPETQGLH